MAACEADETWNALRRLRPDAKEKFLSAACVLIQEIVEDNRLAERFRGWATRWGDDNPGACRLHREVYNMLERHIMGITASQFVWQEHGENEGQQDAAPSGEHGPSPGERDDALVETEEADAGGEMPPTQQLDDDPTAPNARKRPHPQPASGGHDESNRATLRGKADLASLSA